MSSPVFPFQLKKLQFFSTVSFYRMHKGLSRECDFQHRVFKGYSFITSI